MDARDDFATIIATRSAGFGRADLQPSTSRRPSLLAGFDDVAVMRRAVEHGRHLVAADAALAHSTAQALAAVLPQGHARAAGHRFGRAATA